MRLDLNRRATDQRVLDALLGADELTRARIAEVAGVSKPTASESVRRLAARGLVQEGGRAEGGRGRVGTYCRIAPGAGLALAVHAGPGQIVGECVDARAEVRRRVEHPIGTRIAVRELVGAIADIVAEIETGLGTGVPVRVLSVANAVDRAAARLVDVPGSPFVCGGTDLSAIVGPRGVADNDVNWAALAEYADGAAGPYATMLYLYLGAGIGSALVGRGGLVSGERGLAGEVAHVLTAGPDGRATTVQGALAALALLRPGTTALDGDGVRAALSDARRPDLVRTLGGLLVTVIALLEPGVVVVGGPWSDAPGLVADLAADVAARAPHEVPIAVASIPDAPLVGARSHAARLAREALLRPE